jgi:two-component system CheB/CheR fusion protein
MQSFSHAQNLRNTDVGLEPIRAFRTSPGEAIGAARRTVQIIDDDYFARSAVRAIVEGREPEWRIEEFASCEAFLASYSPDLEACLIVDIHFTGMGGLQLLQRLKGVPKRIPIVVISGSSAIGDAVQSMKAGASDFIEKPLAADRLLASIDQAFRQSHQANRASSVRQAALEHLADLTPRQHEVMRLVLAGHSSKTIADGLGINRRTVENHRAAIMHKTGARSLPALARLALSSAWRPDDAAS